MFSVPLNPKLTEKDFQNFLEFLKRNKDLIYDFYFTCRIPPFSQDAMGDTFKNEEDHNYLIGMATYVQEVTGITASAVFNNIEIRPSQQNLDLWIESFKPVYEAGIRSVTIPHTHWVSTGQIQANFPELFIKNTILRNVSEPRDIEKLAKAGFNYINLDRDLMRDHEKLLRFKKAKEKYGVKLSLLANEGCAGGCIMMDEHYQFNNTRISTTPQYFNDPISRVSCPKWDHEDPAMPLKTANFPPWKADWDEFLNDLGIDVIKMHGRESTSRLRETMDIIDKYREGQEILFESFKGFLEETNLLDKPIDVWRNKIKNCKFDCWDCGFCDKIYNAKYGKTQDPIVMQVTQELVDSVNKKIDLNIPGLTSTRVQSLINSLAGKLGSYLEVGSYLGSTGAAALKDNNIKAYFVDNWKEDVTPVTQDGINIVENKKDKFINNIRPYVKNSDVMLFDSHMFAVNTSDIKDVKFFFYDGPHDPINTANAVQYYKDCLADTAVIIFDDANWDGVVKGAADGIKKAGLSILYSKMVLNDIESEKDWWNGLYIVVVTKEKLDAI
jgi:Methyltransferase domain